MSPAFAWFASCGGSAPDLTQEVCQSPSPKKIGSTRNGIPSWASCSNCRNLMEVESEEVIQGTSGFSSGFTSAVVGSAESAIDSALEEMNELRRILHPHGYVMKEIEVSLGLVPSLRLTIAIKEEASGIWDRLKGFAPPVSTKSARPKEWRRFARKS
eukprot:gnl/MRDRNA2_/MRDRNA2_69816_c0_seq3.p1 gnl/MRDRNA2_/MRDRNA2_69816_c0~~gnl/MRDRNA2_/MRDRNA2_69816_c0_seq3.p1  ORF type:complete len:157 (-),score=21.68 gnl/MRDRNA2_/MRDRNA2_69816_c0_seq3:156-626(-)